jgi:hypothetical protein
MIEIDQQLESRNYLNWRMNEVLANRRWTLRRKPFRHIVARHVFHEEAYRSIVKSFESSIKDPVMMHYNEQHDFIGGPLTADTHGPLSLFLSPRFHAIFIRAFNLDYNGLASAGLHRHLPGSRSGFPHNDISPEQLGAPGSAIETVPDGDPLGQASKSGKSVRAAAILFYLNNDAWQVTDGGGTGLYRHWSNPVDDPVVLAPPCGNTILAFECSPYSYHSFTFNNRQRDSVIVFLHRSLDSYLQQWGVDGIMQYADMRR